jgi:hypothetical protein
MIGFLRYSSLRELRREEIGNRPRDSWEAQHESRHRFRQRHDYANLLQMPTKIPQANRRHRLGRTD